MVFLQDLSGFRKGALLLLSFGIVAFGQPAWINPLSLVAAAIGYALFWQVALQFSRYRFWIAVAWFAAVQAVHLSWFTSTQYMGPLILLVYAFLLLAIGIQFGFLTQLIQLPLRPLQMLGMAGFWVLMEWVRIFPCTGFTWDSAGLSLAAHPFSVQFASLFGVYGLSFWVIMTNLLALRAMGSRLKQSWAVWAAAALLPYAFGAIHQEVWERKLGSGREISVALVQTALTPEQKDFVRSKVYVPPIIQWDRILSHLENTRATQFDMIVFPEAALPGGLTRSLCLLELAQFIWESHFGEGAGLDFPPLESPYAKKNREGKWEVSNAFWMQSLSNRFGSEVIAGLDAVENKKKYNAAFHFQPRKEKIDRYEKRVLVPVGEYIPLSQWKFLSQFISEQFTINDSFESGSKAHIFQGILPIGISICLEETYSHLIREVRQAGAEVFVSISNDAWFPASQLARQHYDHARLRANENGICLLRACNTGVTAAIDCFGRTVEIFPISDHEAGVLALKMPIRSYPTLYLAWGNSAILLVSIFSFFGLLWDRRQKKKLP